VVHRTARAGLRVTRGQRRRLVGLLVSAGDVWACVLELNAWRRVLACPACQFTGHRDLSAAASIAARYGGGITPAITAGVTHRRAGAHLPGVAPSRRDPRRRAHHRGARGSPGRHRPAHTSPPKLARKSLATRRGALWNYRQVH
jgi:hypothetical protein